LSALLESNSVFATRSPFILIAKSTSVVSHMLIIKFADYLIVPTSVIKFNLLAEMEIDNEHHQLINPQFGVTSYDATL
jgi:hypothetical protein